MDKVLFSSASEEWSTPTDLFETLNAEFHFTTDVCATEGNARVSHYYSKEQDGLKQSWKGVCWMNPPYGRDIGKWIRKAYESDATVVCLIPSRTDTKYWHDYVMKSEDIRFIRGRLRFSGSKYNAPFPSSIVVFKGGKDSV